MALLRQVSPSPNVARLLRDLRAGGARLERGEGGGLRLLAEGVKDSLALTAAQGAILVALDALADMSEAQAVPAA